MRHTLHIIYVLLACLLPTCGMEAGNQLTVIPVPVKVEMGDGAFLLTKASDIHVKISPKVAIPQSAAAYAGAADEGYIIDINRKGVFVQARSEQGAFYARQTLMQMMGNGVLEIAGKHTLPYCHIVDYPRFGYRGFHLDPCRHFISVENVKKQIDVLSRYKMNTLHFHLTDDQGWRIEIKKYPRLTEVGAIRTEGDGSIHKGFYTQEEIKDIVAYAAARHITVIPELELPGHGMAAIAAYPELSCKGEQWTPRIVWGVEDIVMCPGKDRMLEFLEDVVSEMAPLFPGTFFHIGGDECPKGSWKECPDCQRRIQKEGLGNEEELQSYVVMHMEKVLAGYGKRIIGWDEILEGGLSPDATVMSWRGEQGGIEAALKAHDVIMTPSSEGMYLDAYQGDYKIEPVTIGNGDPMLLARVYAYNPMPDTLVAARLSQHVLGVQCNNWSEYMYTNEKMEYMMYPRALAVAEIGWSDLARKDFTDFCRRVDANSQRLDRLGINYHIPLPEQPFGSCDKVTIVRDTTLTFTTSRPMQMVYTTDGTDPKVSASAGAALAAEGSTQFYSSPIPVTGSLTLKIATVLPSGKMSRVRSIDVVKAGYAPATEVVAPNQGLRLRRAQELVDVTDANVAWEESIIHSVREMEIPYKDDAATLRGQHRYTSVAEGYVFIPTDGVYYLSSTNDQVWIDSKLVIDNQDDVMRFSRHDTSLALARGLHPVKIVYLNNITGGWPSWWNYVGRIEMRKDTADKFTPVSDTQFFYE